MNQLQKAARPRRKLEAMPAANHTDSGDEPRSDLEPWHPVADALVALPARVTTEWVADLDDTELGERLLRAHLVPRQHDSEYIARWRRYWRTLGFDDRRRRRTLARLHSWQEQAEQALCSDLSDDQRKLVRAFVVNTKGAIDRLNKDHTDEPMAWAGPTYAPWPKRMRNLAEILAVAIVEFKEGNINADELAAVLDVVDLQRHSTAIPQNTRDRVKAAAQKSAASVASE